MSDLVGIPEDRFSRVAAQLYQVMGNHIVGGIVFYKHTFEPCHEKTNITHMQKQRRRLQRLCFRYMDSSIPLLSKSKISSL